MIFWQADQTARELGIDTFDRHLQVIDADPLNSTWFQAWQLANDEERAGVLARRASDLLDLDAGPLGRVKQSASGQTSSSTLHSVGVFRD